MHCSSREAHAVWYVLVGVVIVVGQCLGPTYWSSDSSYHVELFMYLEVWRLEQVKGVPSSLQPTKKKKKII